MCPVSFSCHDCGATCRGALPVTNRFFSTVPRQWSSDSFSTPLWRIHLPRPPCELKSGRKTPFPGCSTALLRALVPHHCLSPQQGRELWQIFMLARSASKCWSLQSRKLQFPPHFVSTTWCFFPRSYQLQVGKKFGLLNLQLLVTMHENREKRAWHVELGWNFQEGYHMENLIQKTLGRLKEQPLSEDKLAHSAKKATPRAAGELIPRTTALLPERNSAH